MATVAGFVRSVWRRIDRFTERNPGKCAVFWASGKGLVGSVLADRLLYELDKRKEERARLSSPEADATKASSGGEFCIDRTKMAAFGVWNGLLNGAFLKWLYKDCFGAWFPLSQTVTKSAAAGLTTTVIRHPLYWWHVTAMMLTCNFVTTPLFVTPNYFLIKTALESANQSQKGDATFSVFGVFSRAMSRYRDEGLEYLKVTWLFWIPINSVTFTVIPTYWRVPFAACCSVFALMGQSCHVSLMEEEGCSLFEKVVCTCWEWLLHLTPSIGPVNGGPTDLNVL